ncbi:hypothetical protein [uncultured Ilyobacter sp.]|jgi:hypothetical protein|uniref:hypothetical protein n=1 Tax=uncultured Ilyobacter sp. TaxID=544433 RepID=UPI0029C0DB7C|nr:hypothetical protein [uncultured Ilyobacter sp.]
MALIDELNSQLKKFGYELLKPESKRCMVNNKEIIIRFQSDERVELEPHIFEAEDIKEHLLNFKVTEHEPEILDIVTGETKKSYYSIIIERY